MQGGVELGTTTGPAALAEPRPRAEGEDRHVSIGKRLAVALQERECVSMPVSAVQRTTKNDDIVRAQIQRGAGSLDVCLQADLAQGRCHGLGHPFRGAVPSRISDECPCHLAPFPQVRPMRPDVALANEPNHAGRFPGIAVAHTTLTRLGYESRNQVRSVNVRKTRVLFLCVGNTARSQMAEAFLRAYGGDGFEAHSAGLKPRAIEPSTIAVMQEVGFDLRGHRSKHLRELVGRLQFDYVIIVCNRAERMCPRFRAWVRV